MKIDCLCASSLFSKLKYRSLEKSYCTCSVIICILCGVAQAYEVYPDQTVEVKQGENVDLLCSFPPHLMANEDYDLSWTDENENWDKPADYIFGWWDEEAKKSDPAYA